MNRVTLENFRCFRERQQARLAPLTLLVGENSTGKTSFLALLRALWTAAYQREVPNFKEAPYDLGSFDEIAHYRGGRAGQAHEFTAGFEVVASRQQKAVESDDSFHRFEVTFGRKGTAPAPIRWLFGREDIEVTNHVATGWEFRYRTPRGEWSWQAPAKLGASLANRLFFSLGSFSLVESDDLKPVGGSPKVTTGDREGLGRLLVGNIESFPEEGPSAGAPVRSKPRRTYDSSHHARDPEGDTIPMFLYYMEFFEDKKSWKALKEALENFGRETGLFDEIAVKPLGKRGGEPFQVHVRKFGRRAKGPFRNLIDVGYGVSQVLPVVTDLFRDDAPPMFLLQQPEVHLHPSAQAALGSLFCQIAGNRRQLVVETHSDHLLDRVRMDVRDGKGKLKPDDVSILFFERDDRDVRIHSIRLDEEGNVLDAPRSYRRFFMNETRRSLGL